jgi:hypothetical protein
MIETMTRQDQDHYDEEMDAYAMEDIAADFCDWFVERHCVWIWIASAEYKLYRVSMLRFWDRMLGLYDD